MRTLIKLTILHLFIMVLIYGDSYSQDKHLPGVVNIQELKSRLLDELDSDGYVKDGKYKLTYDFSEDILTINGSKADKIVSRKYKDIILDYYHRDTKGVFLMARPYEEGKIKGDIIGIRLE